jgi:hypothetical protein
MVVDLNDDDDDNNDDERKFHATTAPSGGAGSSVTTTTTPSFSFPGSSLDSYSLFSATTLGNPTSTLYGGGGMGDNSLASNSSSMMSATIASGDSTGVVPILSEDTLKHWNVSGLTTTASTAVTENVPPNSDVTLVATTTTGQRPPRRASTRKRKAAVPKAPATAAAAATATIAPQPKSDSTTIVEIDSATASCPSSSEVNSDDGRYFQAVGPLRFAFIGEWSLLLDPPTSTSTTTTTAASAAPAAAPTEAVPNMSLFSPLLYLSFMQSSSQQQQHPQLPAALALQGVLSAGTTTTGSSSTTSVLRWGSPHMFEDARSGSGSTASGGGYRGRRAAAVSRSDPKVLYPEFLAYQLNLPVTRSSSILVRVQETRLDLLRALITGTRQTYRPH